MKNKVIISSILTIALCFSLIAGSTFALFTSDSTVNIAVTAGDIDLTASIDESTLSTSSFGVEQADGKFANGGAATLSGDTLTLGLMTPGDSASFKINVVNKSNIAIKYRVKWSISGDLASGLVATANGNNIANGKSAWTDLDPVTNPDGVTLETINVVVSLPDTAGNDYKGKSASISFVVEAVQGNADNYTLVANIADLKAAIANSDEKILLTKDIIVTEEIPVTNDTVINGDGHKFIRTNPIATLSAETPAVYTNTVFSVKNGKTLTIENTVVDGGAVWTGEVNEVLQRGTVNNGVTSTGALVVTEANATIILGEGAILQNNDGANAVNLGTRIGGKLILNGGEIINNHSAAGAIWGGGTIVMNSGKISYNHGGIGGAIRAVTNIGTLLTMNGGEMNHNYSDGNGGAIWAGSSPSNNVYVLNGGEMAYNYSATTGGAIYAGFYETVKIGGTFKMHDNDCAANIGSAIRFHDHASFVMTGGEIYNHDDNSLFLNNNSASITGGKIEDNFGYSGGLGLTIGTAEIEGVINYNLSTNHNTAYLAAEFSTFKFTVNDEAANFAQFNFKPAEGYIYTEGDEAKLICMNEGYEVYWDASTSTFRLQAK